MRGEVPIAVLCRRHSVPNSIYYKWSKAFLDAGKNGLTRDTQRDATTDEVRRLKEENASLKTGVDFSRVQIELAQKHVPGARYICEDITEVDFPENTFDGICSYYAIIHIPREEHRPLLNSFQRMLKPGGAALLCLGVEDLTEDVAENYLGTRMYWSHYDAETYLSMLKECGFSITWSRRVADESCAGSSHLFVLVQK